MSDQQAVSENSSKIRTYLLDLHAEESDKILEALLQLEQDAELTNLLRYQMALHLRVIDLASLCTTAKDQPETLWRQAQIVLAMAGDVAGLTAVLNILEASAKRGYHSITGFGHAPYDNAAFLLKHLVRESA